ncbi:MAG: hypothetical protein WD342_10370 [Verrucomicrobiales bacterium]
MKTIAIALSVLLVSIAGAFESVLEREPTRYSESEASTPLTEIADRIAKGEELLSAKTDRGVLLQLLDLLEIPVESQMLVYSKTSAQNSRISPETPRAVYFSENAYVGWVQGGEIEVITFDEKLGAVFHMVHLSNREDAKPPEIVRDRSCLDCHAGSATGGFPGPVVRSVYPTETGQPLFHAGTFRTDDTSPIAERWGGWYVTGSSGKQEHLGNIVATEAGRRDFTVEKIESSPIDDLEAHIECDPYPAGGASDIVALMVFEHQVRVHNALVQANLTARQTLHRHAQMRELFGDPADAPLSETNRRILENQAGKVVEALLFKDEFFMDGDGVDGSLDFQLAFEKDARKNRDQRSLKDFRLYERLFKYRCSYVIYSDVFDHLPGKLKSIVLKRLEGILTDPGAWPEYDYLGSSERKRILGILRETLPAWPKNVAEK